MTAHTQTYSFQAEIKQLLDIVIHSLYSNKEIFLRELISNASDALDRRRIESLTNQDLMTEGTSLEIRLEANSENRTLTISDTGIGMSREEVIENIGTIAKSGTRELMTKLKASKNNESITDLIGQFGVGFYAAFMVANKVTLITRRAGSDQVTRWESTGDGQYDISDDTRAQPGTSITLELKPVDEDNGIEDFANDVTLRRLVKRYSDFVSYPIVTQETRDEPEKDNDGKEIPGKTHTVIEEITLNSMKPIWTRPAGEVNDSEYVEFYKHVSHDWNEPMDRLSLKAEGRIEYQSLLFFPSKAPFDMFYREQTNGLQLYVRHVLIMENCSDLLPSYLRFIKGVVDSPDLPLNVSREMVQQDRLIKQMRNWLTKKILDHLKEMDEKDHDKYMLLWNEFGRVLKEGPGADRENKDRIVPLLYFQSSNDPETLTTLADYVTRMKEDQKDIFYLAGESRSVVENSPHLEAFQEKGYEVIFLTDPVDEILTQALHNFKDKNLKSIGKGTVDLGSEEEKKKAEEELQTKKEELSSLMEYLQKELDSWVREVRLSNRLTTSPACLISNEFDMSPHIEKLLSRSGGDTRPTSKRILELNANHDIVNRLQEKFNENQDDATLADYAHLLMGYALLAEGSDLPDAVRFNKAVGSMMLKSL